MKLTKCAIVLLSLSAPALLAQQPEDRADQTSAGSETTVPADPPAAVEDQTAAAGDTDERSLTARKLSGTETGSLVDVVGDHAEFSILAKAIEAAGLTEELEKTGVRSFFAPTNLAFEKLPDGSLGQLLLAENRERLRSLILNHVVDADVLTMSLRGPQEVTSLGGEKLKVRIGKDRQNVNNAKIGRILVTKTNGVLLATDSLLVPEALVGFAELER